uniref:Uncharacterized protein n=1 Tax=Anguilla anguilla TaxID=7936 RepID=A0A0E9SWG6_ANGAN
MDHVADRTLLHVHHVYPSLLTRAHQSLVSKDTFVDSDGVSHWTKALAIGHDARFIK